MTPLLIFALWRGVYWALAGALFWSMGAFAAYLAAGESWRGFGGGVSLSILSGLVLAATRLRRLRASILPVGAAMCGGLFAALLPARLWFGTTGMTLAAILGYGVGTLACVARSSVAVHGLLGRFLVGALGGAAVAAVGTVFPGGLGWTIGGALGGLVCSAPGLYRSDGLSSWRPALEWILCGAVAGALAGFTGMWLTEQALALPRPFPPLLGLQTDDKVMQWLFHALFWPALLFVIFVGHLAVGRRWRQRLRSSRGVSQQLSNEPSAPSPENTDRAPTET